MWTPRCSRERGGGCNKGEREKGKRGEGGKEGKRKGVAAQMKKGGGSGSTRSSAHTVVVTHAVVATDADLWGGGRGAPFASRGPRRRVAVETAASPSLALSVLPCHCRQYMPTTATSATRTRSPASTEVFQRGHHLLRLVTFKKRCGWSLGGRGDSRPTSASSPSSSDISFTFALASPAFTFLICNPVMMFSARAEEELVGGGTGASHLEQQLSALVD